MSAPTVPVPRHHIGGHLVEALDGDTLAVEDPSTGTTIARVARGRSADVDRAVARLQSCLTRKSVVVRAASRRDPG